MSGRRARSMVSGAGTPCAARAAVATSGSSSSVSRASASSIACAASGSAPDRSRISGPMAARRNSGNELSSAWRTSAGSTGLRRPEAMTISPITSPALPGVCPGERAGIRPAT